MRFDIRDKGCYQIGGQRKIKCPCNNGRCECCSRQAEPSRESGRCRQIIQIRTRTEFKPFLKEHWRRIPSEVVAFRLKSMEKSLKYSAPKEQPMVLAKADGVGRDKARLLTYAEFLILRKYKAYGVAYNIICFILYLLPITTLINTIQASARRYYTSSYRYCPNSRRRLSRARDYPASSQLSPDFRNIIDGKKAVYRLAHPYLDRDNPNTGPKYVEIEFFCEICMTVSMKILNTESGLTLNYLYGVYEINFDVQVRFKLTPGTSAL